MLLFLQSLSSFNGQEYASSLKEGKPPIVLILLQMFQWLSCVAFEFVLWWWSILTGGMLLAVRNEWGSWLIQLRSDLDQQQKVITLLKQIKMCAVNTCFNYWMSGTHFLRVMRVQSQTCSSILACAASTFNIQIWSQRIHASCIYLLGKWEGLNGSTAVKLARSEKRFPAHSIDCDFPLLQESLKWSISHLTGQCDQVALTDISNSLNLSQVQSNTSAIDKLA